MDISEDGFLFLPLGGVGKIGMNVTLYHFRGKWIIIDLGAGFSDCEVMPGVDMVVADLSFITARRNDLLGIVLTHAHEDHIGAIPYLWRDLKCPIYATKFTASFLRLKLAQFAFDEVPITEVDPASALELGPFTLEFVRMTHSIPEMHSIAIHTEAGSVLHTGDWKFDSMPVIGEVSDTEKLKQLGDKGLLAIVSDSTNIFTSKSSGTEGSLNESILDIVKNSRGRVAVSLFASNIARICTLSEVAAKAGRRVAVLGRSLMRAIQAAVDCGYLCDAEERFVDVKQAEGMRRNEILYLCTGCQGEPLAATARLASGSHPLASLDHGDTVIFSSKIIPGNERRIFKVFNRLVCMGVEVVTEFTHKVHVSGHPSRDEVRTLYSLTNPKLCLPVHGEYMHMYEHVRFAKDCGISDAIVCSPGDIVDLVEKKKVGSVSCGVFGIDGSFMRSPDSSVMHARRKMRDAGAVIVTLLLNKDNKLIKEPLVLAPGVLDDVEDGVLLNKIVKKIEEGLYGSKRQSNIKGHVRNLVFAFFKGMLKGRPLVEVHVEYIL